MNPVQFGGVYRIASNNPYLNRLMVGEMRVVWSGFRAGVVEQEDTVMLVTNDDKGDDWDYLTGRDNLHRKSNKYALLPERLKAGKLFGKADVTDVSKIEERLKTMVAEILPQIADNQEVIEITDTQGNPRSKRIFAHTLIKALEGSEAKLFNLSGNVFIVRRQTLEKLSETYDTYKGFAAREHAWPVNMGIEAHSFRGRLLEQLRPGAQAFDISDISADIETVLDQVKI